MTYRFIQDAYQARRGGSSRVLDVCCEGCAKHVTFYQKDGPGSLRRMYVDRFIDMTPAGDELCCPHCQRVLGISYHVCQRKPPGLSVFLSMR